MVKSFINAFALVFSLLFSFSANAQNISLNFDNAKFSDVMSYVIKSLLKKDYVITGGIDLEQKVSFKLTNLPQEKLLETFSKLSNSYGVTVTEKENVLYVSRFEKSGIEGNSSNGVVVNSFSPGAESLSRVAVSPGAVLPVDRSNHEVKVYFPKYRSVDYLNAAVRIAGGHLGDVAQAFGSGSIASFSPVSAVSSGYPASPFPVSSMQQGQVLQPSVQSGAVKDAVIYSGDEKTLVKVASLLEQLDRPVLAVQIKAAVLEITEGADSQRSINVLLNLLKSKVGIVFDAGAVATNQLSFKNTSLAAVLSAVDGDSRFHYLSEPLLRVIDGETAKLTVGQEVPTRGALTQDRNGNTVQSIEYRQAGLLLEVSPRIYADNIQLKINQQISSFTTTNTSGIDSPTLLKREAGSVIRLNDGEVVVLAGLDEERDNKSSTGLAFLPSFLRSDLQTKSKSQILIFMEVKRVGDSI
jgi:type II secretory pathway component GspD/PulD (secretin)